MSEEEDAPPPSSGATFVLLGMLGIVFLVMLGFFYFYLFGGSKKPTTPKEPIAFTAPKVETPPKVPAKPATTLKSDKADKTSEKKEKTPQVAVVSEPKPEPKPPIVAKVEPEKVKAPAPTPPAPPPAEPAKVEPKAPEPEAPNTPMVASHTADSTPPPGPATPPPADTTPPATKAPEEPAKEDLLRFVPEPLREIRPDSNEGTALVNDALARIDEAPADLYSDKAKAKVREGLKAAHRIFKVDTIHFDKGGDLITAPYKEHLNKALQDSSLQDAENDPRAVFFVLGFADKSGSADTNKKLSLSRANAVINLLRNECGVINLTYPVAIGPTEIVAPENKEKNRAAEVWLVLP